MWSVVLGTLSLLIIILHCVLPKRYNSLSAELKIFKIPGPFRVPYFGSAFGLNLHPDYFIETLTRLGEKYKPICRIDLLGMFGIYCIDLDDIKTILKSPSHITKSRFYLALIPWLGNGLLTSKGEKWYKHRKWLTPAFHFGILDQYIDIINKHADILIEQLMGHINEEFVNINPVISLCALDIICETAMGVTINAQKGGEKNYVNATIRMSQLNFKRMHSPLLFNELIFHFSKTGKEQREVLEILHGFTRKIIGKRKEAYYQTMKSKKLETSELDIGKKEKKSFLDLLIDMSGTQNRMTEEEIREEVDTFMFEGHDTVSAALSWAVYLLGSHPEVQERAYEELKGIFQDSDRNPTLSDLHEMKYLERIIKETLRLYPSVPFISRRLNEDVQLKKYAVPASSNFLISIYNIHRDPGNFPEPTKFDPDRFLPEAMQGRHPYSYIPFSAGPRNCIGQLFAMMETKIILCQILRKFLVLSLDKVEDIKLTAELILRPKHGLRIKFVPRRSKNIVRTNKG